VRILIYTHAFAPMTGGVERIVLSLAEGLAQVRRTPGGPTLEVTVVTPAAACGMNDETFAFRIVRQPGLMQLVKLLLGADVIHLAGPALLPLVLARMFRRRVVVEHHGFQTICPNGQLLHEPSQTFCSGHFMAEKHLECLRCNAKLGLIASLRMWMLTFSRRSLCERISANVCPTAWLETVLRLPRSTTILHGLPSPARNAPPTKPVRPETFVFMGRLVGTKGVSVLLAASRKLRERGRSFRVAIIGDGPDRPKLEAQVKHSCLDGCVNFAGRLADAQVEETMAGATAVVVPSLSGEVFGMVAAESMLRGRLVIASDIGALREVVGAAGLTFPAGDEEQLARHMERALDDPELVGELGTLAQARALEAFSHDKMIDDHVRLLTTVLRSPLRPANMSSAFVGHDHALSESIRSKGLQ
jgi:glycosyltransferase involved in cell wall biosynthesis